MLRCVSVLFVLLLALSAFGQTPTRSKYKLELLSMIRSDSTRGYNDIQASILVTPIEAQEWPPILSMRIGIKINDQDSVSYIDIGKHEPQVVRLTVYDRTVTEKNQKLYARIRSKLDLVEQDDLMILWFEFRNVSEEAIQKMSVTYGPWEKLDNSRRVEETFFMEFKE